MPPNGPVPEAARPPTADRLPFLHDVGPEVLDRLCAPDPGYADLFYCSTRRTAFSLRRRARPPRFRPSKAPQLHTAFDEGVGLRLLTREGEAAAFGPPTRAGLDEAAEAVSARARSPRLIPPPPVGANGVSAPSPGEPVSQTEVQALLEQAAEAALGADARVRSVVATYQDAERHTALFSTHAATHAAAPSVGRRTLVALRVEVTVAEGGRTAEAYALGGGPTGFGHFLFHPPETTALQAVARAVRRLDARPAPAGPVPVVFAPGWGGAWLHETIGHLLEADVLLASNSPFRPLIGETVAAPDVTLVDDGTAEGGRATSYADDEGTPMQRTVLIENGRLCGVLTDLRHTTLLDTAPTGNGRRTDYRRPPQPRMSNLLLLAGPAAPSDLLADADGGLWIEQIGDGRVDPATGRFTLQVTDARRIESGRPAATVAPCTLSGDAVSLLQGIRGVGTDLCLDTTRGLCVKAEQPLPVSVGQPTVLVTGCTVAPGG